MYLDYDDFDGPEGMEKVIAVLTAGHLDSFGGYPYDWTEHEGKMFIASLDDGKDRNRTQIESYPLNELRAWEIRARRWREEEPDASWSECVNETRR